MAKHPPCGLYRTTVALGDVPAGQLVYFHDHGDPGPGIYLPKSFRLNTAEWHERGITVPDEAFTSTLAPLSPEGFYVVESPFHCCEKQCVRYESGQLVQLGYDGRGTPILFLPEWTANGVAIPERGTRIDGDRAGSLRRVKLASVPNPSAAPGGVVH